MEKQKLRSLTTRLKRLVDNIDEAKEILKVLNDTIEEGSEDEQPNYTYDILEHEGNKIKSVMRHSDGEMFEVGEEVITNARDCLTIREFETHSGSYNLIVTGKIRGMEHVGYTTFFLDCIQKIPNKQEPLFTTEDGVDVYEGDEYWFIGVDWEPYQQQADKDFTIKRTNTFSTSKAAKDYIFWHKPQFSREDMKKCFNKGRVNGAINIRSSINPYDEFADYMERTFRK